MHSYIYTDIFSSPLLFSLFPLPGHQQASPCMSLVLLKVLLSFSHIKGSFSSSCYLLGGIKGQVRFENWTELVCSLPRRHPLQTSVSPLCFGLQTFLLFITDPFPAFNKVFFPPHHLTLSTSILTFPKKTTTETKLLMGRNGATRDQPLPTLS